MAKKAIETEAKTQNFKLKDDKELSFVMGAWKLAFKYINEKNKIFEMPWQKYLVTQLV